MDKGIPARLTAAGPVTIRKADGTVVVQDALNRRGGKRNGPNEITPEQYRAVYARDGRKCRYCLRTDGRFQVDHVVPVSKGGKTVLRNLVVSCIWCNQKKRDRIWKPVPLRRKRPAKPKPALKAKNLPQEEYRQLRAMQAKRQEQGTP